MTSYLRWLAVLTSGTVLGSCVYPYNPPLETEPHALLKLKYSYNFILPQGTLQVQASVKEGNNKYQSALRVKLPVSGNEVPLQVIIIRPGIDTEIRTWLGVVWETTRGHTICDSKGKCYTTYSVDYNERGCQQMTKFFPQEGKIYLLDYNSFSIDEGCDAKIYEQIFQTGGKFKLKPVGF